jgi:hypothetical protein
LPAKILPNLSTHQNTLIFAYVEILLPAVLIDVSIHKMAASDLLEAFEGLLKAS